MTEYGNKTEPIARVRFIQDHTELIRNRIRQALQNNEHHFVYAGKTRPIPLDVNAQTNLSDEWIRKRFLTVVVTGYVITLSCLFVSYRRTKQCFVFVFQFVCVFNIYNRLHVSRKQKWLSCSSDGDVNDDIILEIKCMVARNNLLQTKSFVCLFVCS